VNLLVRLGHHTFTRCTFSRQELGQHTCACERASQSASSLALLHSLALEHLSVSRAFSLFRSPRLLTRSRTHSLTRSLIDSLSRTRMVSVNSTTKDKP
jgi:hypothetical protein